MHEEILRGSDDTRCLVQENGQIISLPRVEIEARYGVDGIIRIRSEEYADLPSGSRLTHFNLQVSHHKPGSIYALPRIVQPGFYIGPGEEQLPVLDFSGCLIARCLSVKEHVPYESLSTSDFEYSFRHIRDEASLKEALLQRYTGSLPALTQEDILALGVSITELEIIGTL